MVVYRTLATLVETSGADFQLAKANGRPFRPPARAGRQSRPRCLTMHAFSFATVPRGVANQAVQRTVPSVANMLLNWQL